jgi:hypothetical protein
MSLPNPTRVVLKGQQHNAMDSAREALAETIRTFLLDSTVKDGGIRIE